ncbi:MAG TPA: hypothetical protein VFZ61_06245 [Polyangiales bacterium]
MIRSGFDGSVRVIGALLLAAAGCNTPKLGQSGSEEVPGRDPDPFPGGTTDPCPCALVERNALRVTVLQQVDDLVRLRVEEILSGELPLVAGDELEATRYDDSLACYAGCFEVKPGDEAFAFYRPHREPLPPTCEARSECLAACQRENIEMYGVGYRSACQCRAEAGPHASEHVTCGGTSYLGPDEQGRDCRVECAQATADSCPPAPEEDDKRGTVRLSPWSDPIVFARGPRGEVSVRIAELSQLSASAEEYSACRERFGDWVDVVAVER